MRPNLFLFDLDGTLVDTSPDLGGAVNDMRVARGLAPLPLETLRAPSGHGGPALLKAAFGMDRTDPKFESMRAEFLARYAERGASHSAVFPGITDLLAALRAEDFACGVVTNKPQRMAERVVADLNLAPMLSVTVGLGPEGTALKPRPDSILLALRLAGVAPREALYAGDSTSDGVAAHAAGVPFAWVSWGCQAAAPEAKDADLIAASPAELLDWALARRRL